MKALWNEAAEKASHPEKKDSRIQEDNDNRSQSLRNQPLHLHQLPLGQTAFIDKVDWESLSLGEAQRLREFGISEGASVESLHRGGLLGGGALACRVGRMTIAMRADHARAIHVRTGSGEKGGGNGSS